MKVRIADIKVGNRIRRSTGSLDNLRSSIQRVGLMHPIIVDKKNNLLAGFRRLQVAQELKWKSIDAICIDAQTKRERLLIEAEENTTRRPFTPDEIRRIKKLLQRYRNQGFWGRILAWFLDFWDKIWGRLY